MKMLSMEDFDSNELSMALKNFNSRCNNDSEMPAIYLEDSRWNPDNFNPNFSIPDTQLNSNSDQWNDFNERNTDFDLRQRLNQPNQLFGKDESMYYNTVNY